MIITVRFEMRLKKMLVLLSALACSLPSYAVTTGVDFLKFSVGARAAGMGEAFTGIADDVTASCWNPAGLAALSRPELGIMHSDAVMDASLEFVGFSYPVANIGTFALSGIFYIIKPIPVTLGSSASLGDLNWRDQTIAVSYARNITPELSAGLSGKTVQRFESDPIFGSSEGSAYALDFGLLYATPVKGLNAGCSVLNTGTELRMSGEVKKDTLPQTTRVGLAYDYYLNRSARLLCAADVHRILDGSWYAGGGAEINLLDTVFLRTGYYQKEGNIQGNTYGFGFKFRNFQVDYSNIPSSEMVGYNRNSKFTVIVQF
jgi:hypothetical protein